MKKYILAIALILIPNIVNAEVTMETCSSVASTATSIMHARQNGVAMVDMMNIKSNNSMTKLMTVEAFEGPRYSTPEYQQNAISDFSNKWYLTCVKMVKPAK